MPKRLPRLKVGERFGRLRVVIPEGRRKGYKCALCVCDCGKITAPQIKCLRSGDTKSCGCFRSEASKLSAPLVSRTHGLSRSRVYETWRAMQKRCNNPNSSGFEHYGGRGIRVCERWHKFENFYADMGDRPKGMTLERKDNDKGYEPENCIWATLKQQCRNKRNNVNLTFQGKTKCIAEWSEELGLNRHTIDTRLENGWSVERALTTPVRARKT